MYKTDIENYWSGEGGGAYIERNDKPSLIKNNIHLLSSALAKTGKIESVIEFGANVGYVLKAAQILFPDAEFSAVEINPGACETLRERFPGMPVYNESLIGFSKDIRADLVISKTVLMLVEKEHLPKVYETLCNCSNRYILIAEYYNPTPTHIEWRGSRIYKRDHAGEMLDKFPDLRLLDYGFVYHRDSHFPQDDVNWFLLEKR